MSMIENTDFITELVLKVCHINYINQIAAESIENVRTVAALNLEDRMIRNYEQQLEQPYK